MLRRLVSLTLIVLVAVASGARAQESASSAMIGLVTDTTQASLPGATVTVTQVATGAQRVVVTDAEGRFSVPGLRPAACDVKVELTGFRPAEMKELVLRTGETMRPTVTSRLARLKSKSPSRARVRSCRRQARRWVRSFPRR